MVLDGVESIFKSAGYHRSRSTPPRNSHAFGGFPKQIFSISLFRMVSSFAVERNVWVELRKGGSGRGRERGKALKCLLEFSGGPCAPV